MNVNPLATIPCLLLATTSLHVAHTSPNPPPSTESSSVAPSFADRMIKGMLTLGGLHYAKACLWGSALAESAVIVANAYPSLPISTMIFEKLLFGGDRNQIRLTTAASAGIAFGIAGGTLRAWCYRELGKHFTFQMSVMKDHRLVTTGPYRIVRHPSYTGVIMTSASIVLLHATRGSWVRESGLLRYLPGKIGAAIFAFVIAFIPPALFLRMKTEDRAMRKRFGDEWDAWAARVCYMIIPGIL